MNCDGAWSLWETQLSHMLRYGSSSHCRHNNLSVVPRFIGSGALRLHHVAVPMLSFWGGVPPTPADPPGLNDL